MNKNHNHCPNCRHVVTDNNNQNENNSNIENNNNDNEINSDYSIFRLINSNENDENNH